MTVKQWMVYELAVLGAVAIVLMAIGYAAWQVHLLQPHPDAVSQREFDAAIDRLRLEMQHD